MKSNFKVSLADDMMRFNIVMIADIFDKINFPQHEASKSFPQGETRILMKDALSENYDFSSLIHKALADVTMELFLLQLNFTSSFHFQPSTHYHKISFFYFLGILI